VTTPDTPYPLGRIVHHDPLSRNYPFPVKAPVAGKDVIHAMAAPALDQGNLGSCTGNAAAQWLNTVAATKNRLAGQLLHRMANSEFLNEDDAVELYSTATMNDDEPGQYPPDDTGSSGLGVSKAMQRFGFITAYTHAFSFDQFLAAAQHQPVIIGINWYESMFTPNPKTGLISVRGNVAGGHEILVRGVLTSKKRVLIRNSWGSSWGRNGDAYISFAGMKRLLNEQGDVVAPGLMA
jgi:hypothetical protein